MKYEFIKKEEDVTVLKYKEKEYEIKKNVGLMKEMQSATSNARIEMIKDLAKDGLTTKDLVIERKENGKTYYDNTNLNELEQTYMNKATMEMFDNICVKYFKQSMMDLILDIGLVDEEESEKFGMELIKALTGSEQTIPSK